MFNEVISRGLVYSIDVRKLNILLEVCLNVYKIVIKKRFVFYNVGICGKWKWGRNFKVLEILFFIILCCFIYKYIDGFL